MIYFHLSFPFIGFFVLHITEFTFFSLELALLELQSNQGNSWTQVNCFIWHCHSHWRFSMYFSGLICWLKDNWIESINPQNTMWCHAVESSFCDVNITNVHPMHPKPRQNHHWYRNFVEVICRGYGTSDHISGIFLLKCLIYWSYTWYIFFVKFRNIRSVWL